VSAYIDRGEPGRELRRDLNARRYPENALKRVERARELLGVWCEKAERAGVSVEQRVAKDMPHNPPALAAFHPEAAAALQDATAFISRTLRAEPSEWKTAARRDV
jgi:hypothetical protein